MLPVFYLVASKPPILIFSGGGDSQLIKWEQQQLNNFAYSQELFPLNETSMSDGAKANTEKERSRQSSQASDDREADSSSESESDSDISTTERSHSRQRSNHSATKQVHLSACPCVCINYFNCRQQV
jgi:hypothetical protein